MYNVAVSMIIINEENQKMLLVKQYGKNFFRLVAGYVNRTESLEHAAVRELKEETGMTAERIVVSCLQYVYIVHNAFQSNIKKLTVLF